MNNLYKNIVYTLTFLIISLGSTLTYSDNQTATTSPILSADSLPFRISIEQANFQLPVGLQSGLFGIYKGMWVFIGGRTNGMHGINNGSDNFPPSAQNTAIYVVNPDTGVTQFRSLTDPSSGLNQEQIDSLSVASPAGYQKDTTLYLIGGYGINTATGTYGTKSTLTAIYLPGIIQWVTHPENTNYSVIQNIRQVNNPIFQISGGKAFTLGKLTQLVFGQNYTGIVDIGIDGDYSEQVRQFQLIDNHNNLAVDIFPAKPAIPNSSFRRRELNVMPVLLNENNILKYALVAYAGVFTTTNGVWTVPVIINTLGDPIMANPDLPSTFKQGMNQYACATAGLYSKHFKNMYNIFFGGISYGYFDNGNFVEDVELPFINQVTTIKVDQNQNFTQYLMEDEYPIIFSTDVNPGNILRFGAGAYFIPSNIMKYPNNVISLDHIRKPTVIGHIVGGIASTLMSNNYPLTDTFASTYIFKVTLIPKSVPSRDR